jgi:zinc/manganese transport system permease protein
MLLPAAAALCWTQKIWTAIALGVAFGMAADYAGLLMSYYANLPSGPAVVLAGGAMYGLSTIATAAPWSGGKRLKAVR